LEAGLEPEGVLHPFVLHPALVSPEGQLLGGFGKLVVLVAPQESPGASESPAKSAARELPLAVGRMGALGGQVEAECWWAVESGHQTSVELLLWHGMHCQALHTSELELKEKL
jgi:hypothetical protein